jgi:rhodanese-related sulfurtransferase
MRRIVVIAAGPAGILCAVRTKRRLPESEVNLIIPAGLHEAAQGDGPYCRRLAAMLPTNDLRATREVAALEVTDLQPDFDRREITLFSDRGALTVRYNSLILEVPAQHPTPRALQKAGNVFGLPADGFFANAPVCDAALERAAAAGAPVLVVGCGVGALNAVFAALEAHCRVIWVQPENRNEPALESYFERLAPRLLGDVVTVHALPSIPARELDFLLADDGVTFAGIVLPDKGPVHAACCLWAGPRQARHPILREEGFVLDAYGRIAVEPGIEDHLGVYVTGSGAAYEPALLGNGAEAPVYAGGEETALALAAHTTDRITGRARPFTGPAGVQGATGRDLVVRRAGYTTTEAETAGIPAEHTVHAITPAAGRGLLALSLVACPKTRTLLGVQVMGHDTATESAEGLFDIALCALRDGTPLDALTLRDWGGRTGRLVGRCASMLLHKLDGPILGITPDELRASAAAGAKFFMLDLRPEREWLKARLPESHNIPLEQLGKRLQSEVPRMMPLVLISEDAGDAYAAAVRLAALGATSLYVLDGGMRLWPYATES